MKNKIIRSGVLGFLTLLASVIAFIIFQVCFVQSFWLHAIVAPLNPQATFQPATLSYIGSTCEVLFVVLLVLGAALLFRAGWLWSAYRTNR